MHAGDCTIYGSMSNGMLCDGICTCGYGWSIARKGDWSEMYSDERAEASQGERSHIPWSTASDKCDETMHELKLAIMNWRP